MSEHIPLDDLSARLDEALPAARQAQVDAHLERCEDCRRELEALRRAADFMAAMPPVEAPRPLQLENAQAEPTPAPGGRMMDQYCPRRTGSPKNDSMASTIAGWARLTSAIPGWSARIRGPIE